MTKNNFSSNEAAMLTYKVDYPTDKHHNVFAEEDAHSKSDAQAKARRLSRRHGRAGVIAYDNGVSVGDIIYVDGYKSHSDGRV